MEKYTRIYAFDKVNVTIFKWIYLTTILIASNFAIILILNRIILDGLHIHSFSSSFSNFILAVNLGLGAFNSLLMIIVIKKITLEEYFNTFRDFKWDNKYRYVIYILYFVLLVLALIIMELLILLIIFLSSALSRSFIKMIWYPSANFNYSVTEFAWDSTFLVLLFLLFVKKSRRKIRKQLDRIRATARTVDEFKVTSYIPGFYGLTNGEVIIPKSSVSLINRSGAIVSIIYKEPFLLLLDDKRDLFLWKKSRSWIYMGMLKQYESDVFTFDTKKFVMNNDHRLSIKMIKLFKNGIVFIENKEIYQTNNIDVNMPVNKLIFSNVVDFTSINNTLLYIIRSKRQTILRWSGDYEGEIELDTQVIRDITISSLTNVRVVTNRKVLVLLPPPNLDTILEIPFKGQLVQNKEVTTSNRDELAVMSFTTLRKKSIKKIIRINTKTHQIREQEIPVDWIVLYIEDNLYHVQFNNYFFTISESEIFLVSEKSLELRPFQQILPYLDD